MKKILCRAIAAMMALVLLLTAALAEGGDDAAEAVENGVVYATADCSVYAEASSKSEALTELLEGDRLDYLYEAKEDESGLLWYSVNCGDISGWVCSDSARYAGDDICYDTALEDIGVIEATGGDSNIRVAPDRDAEIIGLLTQGETAIYAGKSYVDYRAIRWDLVEFEDRDGNGREGWISSKYTTPKALEDEN